MDEFRFAADREAPDLESLLPCLRDQLPAILVDMPVMLAYMHGSVVEGYATPLSDVDIALVMAPDSGLTGYERLMIEMDIEVKLEKRCGMRQADVRSIDTAPLTVQGRVVCKGELVYSRDHEFKVDYEVRTLERYLDFKPTADMMREAFFERIRREGLLRGKR